MDRTAKYLANGNGRDKFCKMIQYAARFSMHHTQSSPETSQKCRNLFGKID